MKVIYSKGTSSGLGFVLVVEQPLSDGSYVYSVEIAGDGTVGNERHVVADARDESAALKCADAIVAACAEAI